MATRRPRTPHVPNSSDFWITWLASSQELSTTRPIAIECSKHKKKVRQVTDLTNQGHPRPDRRSIPLHLNPTAVSSGDSQEDHHQEPYHRVKMAAKLSKPRAGFPSRFEIFSRQLVERNPHYRRVHNVSTRSRSAHGIRISPPFAGILGASWQAPDRVSKFAITTLPQKLTIPRSAIPRSRTPTSAIPKSTITVSDVQIDHIKIEDIQIDSMWKSNFKFEDIQINDIKIANVKIANVKIGNVEIGDSNMDRAKTDRVQIDLCEAIKSFIIHSQSAW